MTAASSPSLNLPASSASATQTPTAKPKRIARRGGRWYVRRVLQRQMMSVVDRHFPSESKGLLVDYGCGDTPYRAMFSPRVGRYLGLDLAKNPDADEALRDDFTADLPSGAASFVVSTQVLEHVPDPAAYLAECRRLLAPGGKLILSTHGHWRFHPHPDDYWRWTSQGLRQLLGEAGFDVVDWQGVLGLGAVGTLMLQDAVVRRLPRPVRSIAAGLFQWGCALADRLHSAEARAEDAAVYVVIAAPRAAASEKFVAAPGSASASGDTAASDTESQPLDAEVLRCAASEASKTHGTPSP